jgi:hypothetical protein
MFMLHLLGPIKPFPLVLSFVIFVLGCFFHIVGTRFCVEWIEIRIFILFLWIQVRVKSGLEHIHVNNYIQSTIVQNYMHKMI